MRGTPGGETPVSKANTEEYRDNHARIFGDRPAQRGRWIWDETQQKLVAADEYRPPEAARDAPIMVDRFMEGATAQDGTDIGSRRKRREYMQREGVTDSSDYGSGWGDRVRNARERDFAESTRRTVTELGKTDTRNLPNAIEHLRRKGS